jgi:hypothetical protein
VSGLASLAFLAVAFAAVPQEQENGLQAAVRLVGEERYRAALEAARAESQPLARAQAELYVLHQGGALEEALLAGLEGLETSPEDPWLLERSAYLALSLNAGSLAEELYLNLQQVTDEASWDLHEPRLGEARAIQERREAEALALTRARLGVIAVLLATLVPLLFWYRASRVEPE